MNKSNIHDNIINVQQYDNNIKIFINITNDGIVEPILGSTVIIKFMDHLTNRKLIKECTITDAELGECMYILTKSDLSSPGTYNTELEIQYKNGTILSKDNPFTLIINKETIPKG